MYKLYKNFHLDKKSDHIKLSVEGIKVLEKEDDDFISDCKVPKFFDELIEKYLSLDNFHGYSIFTLCVSNHNKISDYKKIWKLGGYDKKGIYEGFYDTNNGRIYFGIVDTPTVDVSNILVDKIVFYIPQEKELPMYKIFDIFSRNSFTVKDNEKKFECVLSELQKLEKDSIVIYKTQTELNIFGNLINQKFDVSAFPKTLMEK